MGVLITDNYRCKRCSDKHSFSYGGQIMSNMYDEVYSNRSKQNKEEMKKIICSKTVNGKMVFCDWEAVD